MFRMLKNSARNCELTRSVIRHFLFTDRSRSFVPLFRKISRPMVPSVPSAGGSIIELPEAKQPHFESELTASGPMFAARDRHAALVVPENQGIGDEAR